ncbi:MAG: endonuclease/exonuclease/phosphatase family protein [Syntrophorhabdaceae bacterium]
MTYNVHSCIGNDGKNMPMRIAKIIAGMNPDIVALQELDVGLSRTGRVDQADLIASELDMYFHFHPSLTIHDGRYGNAILSRYPIRLVKAGGLPSRRKEPRRGALWVEVTMHGHKIQVINTHLGLTPVRRRTQSVTLMGPEWLGNERCVAPVILCGDMNSMPGSYVHHIFSRNMTDAQNLLPGNHRPRRTWPSISPFLRLDHVFLSKGILVKNVRTPRSMDSKMASDHLPLLVEAQLAGAISEK